MTDLLSPYLQGEVMFYSLGTLRSAWLALYTCIVLILDSIQNHVFEDQHYHIDLQNSMLMSAIVTIASYLLTLKWMGTWSLLAYAPV